MKNSALEKKIRDEMMTMILNNKSLHLASIDGEGHPYASYAPFATDEESFYVLLSEIAVHGINLQHNPRASILIIEDEKSAPELFARVRINYSVKARPIEYDSDEWKKGIATLATRHGERIGSLSQLNDFRLFRLSPVSGRYVKGFGKAYSFSGGGFFGETLDHMRDGHRQRTA